MLRRLPDETDGRDPGAAGYGGPRGRVHLGGTDHGQGAHTAIGVAGSGPRVDAAWFGGDDPWVDGNGVDSRTKRRRP